MTALEYRRLSAAPPPAREIVRVDASGTWRSWRSTAAAVGRFGGHVDDPEAFAALVDAARRTPAPTEVSLPPDAVYERIELDGTVRGRFAEEAPLDGPWGALRGACRGLVASLDDPLAAVALVIEDAGVLRLEHRGGETLTIQLGVAYAEAVRWKDGGQAGSRSARGRGEELVEAGPGWTRRFELGEVPGGAPGDGSRLVASVSFLANDGGVWVPVSVEAIGA